MIKADQFTIAKTVNQPRGPPTNDLDKENVVYLHYGISVRHKKSKVLSSGKKKKDAIGTSWIWLISKMMSFICFL